MMTLMEVVHQFAKDFPTPRSHPNGGANTWDQWCGAAIWRLCEAYGHAPTGDVHSAYAVYMRSTIVSTDSRKALPGDVHFWDIAGPENGHVMLDVLGGGTTVFGGTRSAKSIEGATALGLMSVRGYTLAKLGRARYLGFSRGYANGRVTDFRRPVAPAALDTKTPVLTATQRKNMSQGFSTKNYGQESFGMLVDGRWATVPTKSAADAISVSTGPFTVLSVKDFYKLRDANTPAPAAPAPPAAPALTRAEIIAAIKAAL